MVEAFYRALAEAGRDPDYLAVYVTEGRNAGKKSLYMGREGSFRLIGGDPVFPDPSMALQKTAGGSAAWHIPDGTVFAERFTGPVRLVVCGAGHVSLPVIRIGKMLGYEVTVLEDREAFAKDAGKAGADHVLCGPFEETLQGIPGDMRTAFVVVTREHRFDLTCLRQILEKPFAYAGMMGSRSRAALVREELAAAGTPAAAVDRVHMPVGIRIGSQTPEEIAVSILAEIISVMNASRCCSFPEELQEGLRALAEEGSQTKAAFAMIIEKNGEAPRSPGTKMLIFGDGTFAGTIGGGYAEAQILKAARAMLTEDGETPRLVRIAMHASKSEENGMYCGGEIVVYLEVIKP